MGRTHQPKKKRKRNENEREYDCLEDDVTPVLILVDACEQPLTDKLLLSSNELRLNL